MMAITADANYSGNANNKYTNWGSNCNLTYFSLAVHCFVHAIRKILIVVVHVWRQNCRSIVIISGFNIMRVLISCFIVIRVSIVINSGFICSRQGFGDLESSEVMMDVVHNASLFVILVNGIVVWPNSVSWVIVNWISHVLFFKVSSIIRILMVLVILIKLCATLWLATEVVHSCYCKDCRS